MSLKDRIIERLQEKSAKKTDLAKATNSPRATVTDWTSGKTKALSGEKLLLASKFLGVTPTWLSTGKGDKYHFRYELKPRKKQHLNVKESSISKINKDNFVPLISWVSAGTWCEPIDNYSTGNAEEWLPCPAKCSKNTYALKVLGDSMTAMVAGSKTYPDGCIIYVDPNVQVTNGKRVIAKLIDKNEVTFKTYKEDAGKKWLMPINTQYENILIDENVIICGVIIAKYEQE